ncbi:BglG family transcription antiterminator [Halanaerobium hydrogeniformans]|uniref:Transcriptional antiterminator, BglG n=1 Tax=Halanaerobium hydrogeniformans TaxID=656519 RepID=E4RNF6_HALHG|nr:BglG family transcription antiterminator [Halanaerobium hydrogeniformans]ADQ13624.1 transcriptional antiterminator, BglG [Halanaerobium hydrogeniformans]
MLIALLESDKAFTTAELAEKLSVSARTIRSDLKKLQDWIKEKENIVLSIKPGVGVSLEISEEKRKKLKQKYSTYMDYRDPYSPEKRRQLILKWLLQSDVDYTIQKLADKLYLSRTTVYKDLDKVEEWLNKYNLKLQRKRRYGLKIKGEEKNWRKAVADLLTLLKGSEELKHILGEDDEISEIENESRIDINTYQDLKLLFSEIDFKKIEDILIEAEKEADFLFTDETLIGLIVHLAISLERLQQDKDIEMGEKQLNKLKKKEEFKIAKFIAKKLEDKFSISIPEAEIAYISLHILGAKYQQNIKQARLEDIVEESNSSIVKMSKEIIDTAGKVLEVDLSRDREVLIGLILHFRAVLNRLQYGLSLRNPILEEIKDNYPDVFAAAWSSSIIYEKHFNIQVSEEEIGYIALHLGAALERLNKSRKVLVVCGSGGGTAQLLAERLKRRLSGLQIAGVIAAHKLDDFSFADIDLIISTIPLNKEFKVPVIKISPLCTDEDIKFIQQEINGLIKKNRKQKNLRNNRLHDLIDADLIFCSLDLNSKEEIIKFLSREMLKRGIVKRGFESSVFERERLTSTEMGNGIALPHAEKKYINSSKVIIANLAKTVQWDERKVKLVFMVALKSKDEAETFFKKYLHIIDNDELLKKLKETNSKKQVKDIFLGSISGKNNDFFAEEV